MKKDVLKEIIQKKKERIILAKQNLPEEELKLKVQNMPPTRPFTESISKPRQISLIAEIKKSSPSRGVIREDFNVTDIARTYQEAGVAAISVLTEEDFFLGNISHINEVKSVTSVPVLRKDFIIEPYQVYESRFFGADAILLIADLLSKEKLSELTELAANLDLDCLVEVHDEKELKKVLGLKAPLIGINNRDLHTLEINFKTTEKLFLLIPSGKIVIVESGITAHKDIKFLQILGVSAILIGTAFMDSPDIKKKIQEIMGW